MEKPCTKCKQIFTLDSFNKKKRSPDGHQNICKECSRVRSRQYYNENTSKHLAKIYVQREKNRAKAHQFLLEYWKEHPCVDCGETHPACLQFDHVKPGKRMAISSMLQQGFSVRCLQKEMSLCEVRCANCHSKRTAQVQNWYCKLPF